MRRWFDGLGFILLMLLVLNGCATENHLKPPKPPESFDRPPDEKRYQEPPDYPKKYLMEDMPRQDGPDTKNKGLGNGSSSGFGNQRSY